MLNKQFLLYFFILGLQTRQASSDNYNTHVGTGGNSNAGIETEFRQHLIVAVGSPLPTPSQPAGTQQGPVVLTAKNLQCMRAILSVAHCHGAVLGSAWHMVLTTLQVRIRKYFYLELNEFNMILFSTSILPGFLV